MLPGPSYVYECKSCKGLFERRSISSGNTSRAKFRSDGQMSAPMLPTTPLLVACPHCKSSIFWPTAKEVDSYETYDLTGIFDVGEMLPESLALRAEKKAKKQKYQDVLRYEQASPAQIDEFIQNGGFDSSYEFPLRLQFWQRCNDGRLEVGRVGFQFYELENLQKLSLLIDQSSDSHLLLQSEIFRELGEFGEARRLLDFDFDEDMAARAEQLMLASAPLRFFGNPVNAHQMYLQMALSLGIVGLVPGLALVAIPIRSYFVRPKLYRDVIVGLILLNGITEADIFATPILSGFIVFWFLLRDGAPSLRLVYKGEA